MKWQRMFLMMMLCVGITNCARAQHSDLELFDEGGRVGVEPRIAEGEFGETPNPAYRADEPGLESDPNELAMHGETPLPGGALVGFDVLAFTLSGSTKSLFYWDGVGATDFVSVAAPHELKISDSTSTFSVQFDGAVASPGFGFALTADGSGPDPVGLLHSHLMFDLVDSAGMGSPNPAVGVYAFATTLRVSWLADSEPVYWVLANGVDESVHESAVLFIESAVGVVPEPGSFGLAGGFLLLVVLRRSSVG